MAWVSKGLAVALGAYFFRAAADEEVGLDRERPGEGVDAGDVLVIGQPARMAWLEA